jgi:anti-sigma regulatory factor (Ser/Thr protein kinase)
LRYWIADGSERLVDFALHPIRDDSGAVRFLYPTGIDITDRVRAEEALLALEAEEREIALGLQRALLPAKLVVPEGVSVSARYEAGSTALEVGGDWYDVFALPDGRVAFTVGDVVGHGLAAAAAMGQLRTALAALAPYAERPGDALTRLDDFVGSTDATDFATVCYGALDPATGAFEYASAGHPPILLVPPTGAPRWLAGAQSPPLWGGNLGDRPTAMTVLEPGSLLVLYSDGLIERRGELIEDSLGRLMAVGASLSDLSPFDVCQSLLTTFGIDGIRDDDIAVLAVRFEPDAKGGFYLTFPAEPQELSGLRQSMRSWLEGRDVPGETRDAVLLAVGEACSNSIEHAYHSRPPGEVTVRIDERLDDFFAVTVRDYGRFLPVSDSPEDRGRGTTLMKALTSDFARTSTGEGTTVRFRLPIRVNEHA